MKLEKIIAIKVTEEERNTIREITGIVEDAFNILIEERPEVFIEVISGIYGKQSIIRTALGNIKIEYDT